MPQVRNAIRLAVDPLLESLDLVLLPLDRSLVPSNLKLGRVSVSCGARRKEGAATQSALSAASL